MKLLALLSFIFGTILLITPTLAFSIQCCFCWGPTSQTGPYNNFNYRSKPETFGETLGFSSNFNNYRTQTQLTTFDFFPFFS